MKSEERHRLEKNALADWLGQTIISIKPYLNTILWVAVIGLLVVVVGSWWMRSSAQGNAAAWRQFYQAMTSGKQSELEQVIDDHKGTDVAHWAMVVASDQRLAEGAFLVLRDQPAAIQELRKAVDGYTEVLEKARDAQLRERAYYGRARAYEALAGTKQSDGGLDKALADYQQVLKLDAKGAFAATAKQRIERLETPELKLFYDKLAAQEPKAPLADEPGTPGKRPATDLPEPPAGDLSKILNQTDVKVNPAPKVEAPKAEAPKAEAPKAEAPKAEAPKAEAPKAEAPKAEAPKDSPAKK